MEELQKLSDEEDLAIEIDNFNIEIDEFHKDLITREVELLNGLEVGSTSRMYFTDPHVNCYSQGISSFILTDRFIFQQSNVR